MGCPLGWPGSKITTKEGVRIRGGGGPIGANDKPQHCCWRRAISPRSNLSCPVFHFIQSNVCVPLGPRAGAWSGQPGNPCSPETCLLLQPSLSPSPSDERLLGLIPVCSPWLPAAGGGPECVTGGSCLQGSQQPSLHPPPSPPGIQTHGGSLLDLSCMWAVSSARCLEVSFVHDIDSHE